MGNRSLDPVVSLLSDVPTEEPMKIVKLDDCRQLLGQIEDIRGLILRGEVSGIACCIRDTDGAETLHVAGEYRRNKDLCSRAALRMSLTIQRDKPGDAPVPGFSRR
jgi:hypothetical protein